MSPPQKAVVVFLRRGSEILLGHKKRGFGAGCWNGVGGKVEAGESNEQAAVREMQEEINVTPGKLTLGAHIIFHYPGGNVPVWDASMYICKEWEGKPAESEEMRPQWFALDKIPYDQMWEDDKYWLPRVLAGEVLEAEFTFGPNGTTVADQRIVTIP